MPYIELKNIRTTPSEKTKIFDVFNGSTKLGEIKWFANWRRYCFYPLENRLFDRNCLLEIINVIDREMKLR